MNEIKILDKVFKQYISYNEIKKRIKKLALQIETDYGDKDPIFISILNGSFMFAAELFKNLNIPCNITFVKLASYQGTQSSGKIKELVGFNEQIEGRTVIVIEDIVDTGNTIIDIVKDLESKNPKEIVICTLLLKPEAYNNSFPIKYRCFEIPNDFIVGFGLDYNSYGRNFKDIYVISNQK